MMNSIARGFLWILIVMMSAASASAGEKDSKLRLSWKKNYLTIHGEHLPGKSVKVMYLEAYCRPGSTDREWGKTTIGHKTELLEADKNGQWLKLKCLLNDGVTVMHEIRTESGAIDFRLVAHNPTDKSSLAHWAQPCVRVDKFTGLTQKTYLPKSFVFLDGKSVRMPTPVWATKARYIPGQVWAPKHVNRNDVNPRPLSPQVPSNGLIGCYSGDDKMILASAWEPYQELFQGVATCVHSDFRIGGLKPGETKKIRGKLYLVDADMKALVSRYQKDFPEHSPAKKR
jgi:hypothetical protein